METKKVAIIASAAILAVGVAVIALLVWRAARLAEEGFGPAPTETTPGQEGTVPTGGETPAPGPVGADQPAEVPPVDAEPQTKIDPKAKVPACDRDAASLDCDNDGLTNGEEAAAKTDPTKADTDGDGVTDGGEVLTWKTDPLNPRSVDPTMTDLEAINSGKKSTR
jgi:hypothetical protein